MHVHTQSGCCKPPSYCGFEYRNATYWVAPKTGPAVPDTDCTTWSNEQTMLCFNCKSCKAGVLSNIRKEWRRLAIFNSCVLIILTLIYCIGCCATRNNRSSPKYTTHRGHPWWLLLFYHYDHLISSSISVATLVIRFYESPDLWLFSQADFISLCLCFAVGRFGVLCSGISILNNYFYDG